MVRRYVFGTNTRPVKIHTLDGELFAVAHVEGTTTVSDVLRLIPKASLMGVHHNGGLATLGPFTVDELQNMGVSRVFIRLFGTTELQLPTMYKDEDFPNVLFRALAEREWPAHDQRLLRRFEAELTKEVVLDCMNDQPVCAPRLGRHHGALAGVLRRVVQDWVECCETRDERKNVYRLVSTAGYQVVGKWYHDAGAMEQLLISLTNQHDVDDAILHVPPFLPYLDLPIKRQDANQYFYRDLPPLTDRFRHHPPTHEEFTDLVAHLKSALVLLHCHGVVNGDFDLRQLLVSDQGVILGTRGVQVADATSMEVDKRLLQACVEDLWEMLGSPLELEGETHMSEFRSLPHVTLEAEARSVTYHGDWRLVDGDEARIPRAQRMADFLNSHDTWPAGGLVARGAVSQ